MLPTGKVRRAKARRFVMNAGILKSGDLRQGLLNYGPALGLSIVLHVAVVAVLFYNWKHQPEIAAVDADPYYIGATTVTENPHRAREQRQLQTLEQRREQRLSRIRAERAAAAEAEALRREENERRMVAENEDRRKQLAAIQSQLESSPQAEPVQRIDTPTSTADIRQGLEGSDKQALMSELAERQAVTNDEKAKVYASQIKREVEQMWSRPPSARNGMEVLLQVHLVPTGEVVDVHVLSSSDNDAFDRSAIHAVRKADRFLVPADSQLFESTFRVFELLFRPEDLRL